MTHLHIDDLQSASDTPSIQLPFVRRAAMLGDGGLMEGVELFLSLFGLGTSIEGLFGGSAPSLPDILAALTHEIEQIFRQELADDAIKVAAGILQSSRDFLAVDYLNAVNNGVSDAVLYGMLTQGSDDRGTGALDDQASIMEGWANDPNLYASNAQPTVSLALAIHALLVTYYREQALRAPTDAIRNAASQSMRDYAARAVARVAPLIQSVTDKRLDGVGQVGSQPEQGYFFVWDSWYSERKYLLFTKPVDPEPNDKPERQINAARAAYLQLLRSGSDASREALVASIGDTFVGDGDTVPSGPQLISDFVPEFQRWAIWRVNAILSLDKLGKVRDGLA